MRMARARLLHVPRDERRPARAGRTLRLDVEPQFRRPPGPRRPHASDEPRHGRSGGDCRASGGRAGVSVSERSVDFPTKIKINVLELPGRFVVDAPRYDTTARTLSIIKLPFLIRKGDGAVTCLVA